MGVLHECDEDEEVEARAHDIDGPRVGRDGAGIDEVVEGSCDERHRGLTARHKAKDFPHLVLRHELGNHGPDHDRNQAAEHLNSRT